MLGGERLLGDIGGSLNQYEYLGNDSIRWATVVWNNLDWQGSVWTMWFTGHKAKRQICKQGQALYTVTVIIIDWVIRDI